MTVSIKSDRSLEMSDGSVTVKCKLYQSLNYNVNILFT